MRKLPAPEPSIFLGPLQESIDEQTPHQRSWAGILTEYSGLPRYADGASPIEVARSEMTKGTDEPWINYLVSTANTLIPVLLARHPKIQAHPTRAEFTDKARVYEGAADTLSRKAGVLAAVRTATLDCMLFGHAIAKVGWDDPEAGALTSPDYDDGREAQVEDDPMADMPAEKAARIRKVLEEMGAPVETPTALSTVRRVAPWNFFIAPGAPSPAESPWVAERILVSDDELRAVDFFTAPPNCTPDTILSPTPLSGQPTPLSPARTPTHHTVWEIRYWRTVGRKRQRCVLWIKTSPNGTDGAAVLAHIVDPSRIPGWPYEVLRDVAIPDSFYSTHVSDLSSIRELATRLNEEWHYILKHHRLSSRRKYLFGPGIDEAQLRTWLESEEDMVGMQTNTDDVGKSFALLPEAPPPKDTDLVLNGLRSLMFEVSGMDAFQRGALPTNTTATAASLANQSTAGRLAYRLDLIETFYRDVVARLLASFREFGTAALSVRLAGVQGYEFFQFDPTDAMGGFDLEMEPGSTLPRDPQSKQNSYLGLLNAIGTTLSVLLPAVQAGVVPQEAIAKFIARAFDLWQQDKDLFSGPLGQLAQTFMQSATPGAAPGAAASPATPAASAQPAVMPTNPLRTPVPPNGGGMGGM